MAEGKAQPSPKAPPQGEVAWSESLLYGGGSFPKYDPDALKSRRGHAIYDQMLEDEQVKAAWHLWRAWVLGRRWRVTLESPTLADAEAARRVALVEAILAQAEGNFLADLQKVLLGVVHGFSLTEIVTRPIEWEGRTWVGLRALKARPASTFRFRVDPYGNILGIVQELGGRKQEIDPQRFIHYVHRTEWDPHYGRSELREMYRSWFSKDVLIKFWNIWLERHASGLVVIRPQAGHAVTPGSTEETDLKQLLGRMQTSGAMLLPSGYELDLHQMVGNVRYEQAISWHDRALAKSFLVPPLLGISDQGSTGAYSQALVQFQSFFLVLEAVTAYLAEVLAEQFFRRLGRWNFPDAEYPVYAYDPLTQEQLIELANTWGKMVGFGAVVASESDEARLREILGMPERGAPLGKSGPVSPITGSPAAGGNPAPQDADGREPPPVEPGDGPRGSTQAFVSARAFTLALKRVDFSVLDRRGLALEDEASADASRLLGEAVADVARPIWRDGTPDVRELPALRLDGGQVRRLRAAWRGVLERAWTLGEQHARRELEKAALDNGLQAALLFESLEPAAAAYLDAKSFQIAGDLSDAARSAIQRILARAITMGRPGREVVLEIYSELARQGLLGPDAAAAIADDLDQPAREALARLLGTGNPDARLHTVARTNISDAINEARWRHFSDPRLQGFVRALEYSAILDGRTTTICERLDGKIWATESSFWTGSPSYRPPNHFNCRSILVAVTVHDAFEESPPPSVWPLAGFG